MHGQSNRVLEHCAVVLSALLLLCLYVLLVIFPSYSCHFISLLYNCFYLVSLSHMYTVNQKKTWLYIF